MMSRIQLETQQLAQDVNDGTKVQCCIINGTSKDAANYDVTSTNVLALSWLIWNQYSITSSTNSRVLYHVENSNDVQNFKNPIASRKELDSLLLQFCGQTNNTEHKPNVNGGPIYLLSHNSTVCSLCFVVFVCLKSTEFYLFLFVLFGYFLQSIDHNTKEIANFTVVVDLKDLITDKDKASKLEFSLIQGSNTTDPEVKHDDRAGTVTANDGDINNNGSDIYNDCDNTSLNVNEHDLWRALWQKLNYNLSMSLYKVDINQWQNTHTLYFELQRENEAKELKNDNNNNKTRLLVKSLNDLIFIATHKIKHNDKPADKKDENIKGRIVLNLKVELGQIHSACGFFIFCIFGNSFFLFLFLLLLLFCNTTDN